MNELRWEPILPILTEFQQYLADYVPTLQIQAAVDRQWSDAEYRARRPDGFPSRLRGVYLIFGPDEQLLYVGLATYDFDSRVWSHDHELDRRWTDIVQLDDQFIFLAPALEFYLISRLKPPHNRVYRGHEPSSG